MAKGNYLKGVRVCIIGRFKHNHTEIKKWIQAGGGVFSTAVDSDTTHIVVSADQWKKKISPALANKDAQYERIQIVTYEWLENTKQQKVEDLKIKEREKKAKVADLKIKEREKKAKIAEKAAHKAAHMALTDVSYRRAFVEHISAYGGYTKEEILRQSKAPKSAPSHPYTDENGLCYDIDVTTRKNERLSITMSETEAEQQTYGVSIRTSKTNTTEVIGVNIYTALRSFKKIFRENTGVEWDDRLKIAERIKLKGSRKAPAEVIVIDDD